MVRTTLAAKHAKKENGIHRLILRKNNVEFEKSKLKNIRDRIGKPLTLRQRRIRTKWNWLLNAGNPFTPESVNATILAAQERMDYIPLPWPENWFMKICADPYRQTPVYGHAPGMALSVGWPRWMEPSENPRDNCEYCRSLTGFTQIKKGALSGLITRSLCHLISAQSSGRQAGKFKDGCLQDGTQGLIISAS
ncbi:hypothetical protein MRV_0130 [Murine roseolovirus]|uniref:Uncharacterized protein n=1 Tax=Murid betaherpesvirus 3 TaxID=2560603 RepID=A0A1P8VIP0_9BETA|nr:hypothetical protein MRV_0002 [Murine roseolovirus]YP_009344957.1 hypothetical protein MRV_0130 [Murine roseolovirus]APZ76213.1 hypothetical protein MRV_0002 [Murid betaherpesvirus 3]APZ76341.1 hypothetical protein MRV_0130 [Murid betaherpesvirus 3]